MDMPRSQPSGRSKLLSLRRRNKDPGTSSTSNTQQFSQSKEVLLPQAKENSVPIVSKDPVVIRLRRHMKKTARLVERWKKGGHICVS